MVFIHGGGFTVGSANTNLYEATSLSLGTQTVVVTINYRLGALGFLNAGSGGVNGNMGLMDQVSIARRITPVHELLQQLLNSVKPKWKVMKKFGFHYQLVL